MSERNNQTELISATSEKPDLSVAIGLHSAEIFIYIHVYTYICIYIMM